MAGTTTETAIRVMSHLKDRGIIRSVRGKVIILDEGKLRLLGEGPPRVQNHKTIRLPQFIARTSTITDDFLLYMIQIIVSDANKLYYWCRS